MASLSWTINAFPVGDQLRAELNSESEAHSMVWYSLKGKVCLIGGSISIVELCPYVNIYFSLLFIRSWPLIDEKGFLWAIVAEKAF